MRLAAIVHSSVARKEPHMKNYLDLFHMGSTLVDCKNGYAFYRKHLHRVERIPATAELVACAEALRSRLPLPRPLVVR